MSLLSFEALPPRSRARFIPVLSKTAVPQGSGRQGVGQYESVSGVSTGTKKEGEGGMVALEEAMTFSCLIYLLKRVSLKCEENSVQPCYLYINN